MVSDKKKHGNFIVSANVVKSKYTRVWNAGYTGIGCFQVRVGQQFFAHLTKFNNNSSLFDFS